MLVKFKSEDEEEDELELEVEYDNIVKAGLPASHEDDEPLIAYIAWVEVSKGWEGRRIGITLVSEGIRELRRLYPDLAAVWAAVLDDNEHSEMLFRRLNFERIGGDSSDIRVLYFNK
ncbi:hypothetical protein Pmar_PMAR000717 [Perkinsus marinus ATCC 50983]|uniref:N-acetyltransferase domain-containing protein n=1 Tax=Perkinsus marinus (strain ATCC 50983 / TXsc) TaxID=423536 RepID=C5KXG0_PERM5|nr:hypothetical protein Pmar_PMAR000717 [Perkinsus marinus ATCC 50983]EER10684.1 hypothetical protein Pmar_PMAR000717 [Perkinsus marinus ATCC 50983]|eukprot:XP_002778889.1 hypothetical protein Pmar_PMAR000717 [Perkinsus marinus ATCC 50983]